MRSARRTPPSPRCRCRAEAARSTPRATPHEARSSPPRRRRLRPSCRRSAPRLRAAVPRARGRSRAGRRRRGPRAPPLELSVGEVAAGVEEGGLQPREGEIEPGHPGDRKRERVGVAVSGEAVDDRASRIPEPEQPCPFVERLRPRRPASEPSTSNPVLSLTRSTRVCPPLARRHVNGGSSGLAPAFFLEAGAYAGLGPVSAWDLGGPNPATSGSPGRACGKSPERRADFGCRPSWRRG